MDTLTESINKQLNESTKFIEVSEPQLTKGFMAYSEYTKEVQILQYDSTDELMGIKMSDRKALDKLQAAETIKIGTAIYTRIW